MSNLNYLEKCLEDSDICAVQEHWLYPDSLHFLSSIHEDFVGWGRCSNDLNLDSVWRRGMGGIALLWRKDFDLAISKLDDMGSDRILVMRLKLGKQNNLFIINVYFPASNSSILKYKSCIDDLEDIINRLHGDGTIIILGDFNGHVGNHLGSRSFNATNQRGLQLIHLLRETNFVSINSQSFCQGPIETFSACNGSQVTSIDHIMIRKDDLQLVKECYVADDHCDNLSYHLPIFCTICTPAVSFMTNDMRNCRVAWKTIKNEKVRERYRKSSKQFIENLITTMPTLDNTESIEQVALEATEGLKRAALKSIPTAKFKPNLKSYWKDGLDGLHENSRRHRRTWIQAGRPREADNLYFRNYKDAKRVFRRELRRKSYENEMKNLEDDAHVYDFDRSTFQKIMSKKRNLKGRTRNELKIGDRLIQDDKELLDIWKCHYKDLYTPKDNSMFDNEFKHFVETRVREFESKVEEEDYNDPLERPLTVDQVHTICRKLPNGKSGGIDGLLYEHLKYADISLYELLTKLFNAMRNLEYVPESCAVGKIISLYKGKKKDRLKKCSYRGITLLSALGKVFERLTLDLWMPTFQHLGIPHPMQFAYQTGRSCTQASFVIREAVYHYLERGSKVYACFLDSTKAFDTVWLDGLFFKLYNLGIKGKTWRLLRKWYGKLTSCVSVNGLTSDLFPVLQGVRQGGVLSPWLYMCFNNDIPSEIGQKDNGISVNETWYGNVLVADDITLLSSRSSGLQAMLTSMERYSKRWRFEFNPDKSVEVTFGESTKSYNSLKNRRVWWLNDCSIKVQQSCEHVGMILTGDGSQKEQCDVAAKKGKEVVSCLLSCGIRPGGLNPICGVELWRTVGLARMLYGCELWCNMSKSDIYKLEVVNRFAAKRIQGLSSTTRSEAVTGSIGLWTVEGYIDKAKLLFLYKLMKSSSSTAHKSLFVTRLLSYFYKIVSKPLGFIPDVFRILQKYELLDYIDDYMTTGILPSEKFWKATITKRITCHQNDIWKKGISEKPELSNFGKIHAILQPLDLWYVAKRNPLFIREILNTVNIVCGNVPEALMNAVIDSGAYFKCRLCSKDFGDVSRHFLLDCPHPRNERELMFDKIQDFLHVSHSASLFNQPDEELYLSLLGGNITSIKTADTAAKDNFVIIVATGFLKIILHILHQNDN